MKIKRSVIISLLTIIGISLNGQIIENKRWLKVKAERKDGSKIIDRININESELTYFFEENGSIIIGAYDGERKTNYSINDSIIEIGKFQKLQIENLNDSILVVSEIPEINLPDDKINRLIFFSESYYYNILLKNNLLKFINDSTIRTYKYICPKFIGGNFDTYFIKGITKKINNSTLIGNYIVSPDGNVVNSVITLNQGTPEPLKEEFIKLLNETKYISRNIDKPLYQKISFSVKFINAKGFKSIIFDQTNNSSPSSSKYKSLGLDNMKRSADYFNKGNKMLLKSNFEKSINYYTKCIEIDSIYLDAFYNRAYSYYNLKMLEKACKDWKYLNDLEQKEAEKLYITNCKQTE